mmetsp:Transcript_35245/g.75067  ORF Transcript_35245/g.75067 Transcript_35245/m.75067 type:complete len:287 (-) Transcript_35245:49-909(-)|eukprot:CAMPEP_0206561672 /NCGR_PEP_ID=MMETSP0325_2-20121206/21758_1 /ASSEMBLY_ACC=CAM_ASM_000347 /TAXON_ID=2866 /ORGANISM="Crypthecodinium cohnii, Strain Seligo" /LENGTH=286 /DNA_ID=CAMNT_0054063667 /DNA_START=58 /DNA_END=918 /DNA_ORIENTATION=-
MTVESEIKLDFGGSYHDGGSAPSDSKPSPDILGSRTSPLGSDADEDAAAIKLQEEAAYVRSARLVSVISVLASAVAAVLGIGLGVAEGTLSLVGFGFEALLDGISSAMVLWRYKTPKAREHKDEEAAARFKEARDARRERNSGIGIGAIFVLSALLLYSSALHKALFYVAILHATEEQEGAASSLILSIPSSIIFSFLARWKLNLARKLGSQVLYKDGLCSALGAFLALIVFIAGILEEVTHDAETMKYVDALASALIATVLLVEGARSLWKNLGLGWAEEHQELA